MPLSFDDGDFNRLFQDVTGNALFTDVLARYHRLAGRRTFFLTGADEHGQKIANTAAKEGKRPIELVDECVAKFKALDARLDVSYDDYLRTTSCLLYTSPSPRDKRQSRMPSSA